MKTERIEDILARCLERIAAGEDVSACLRDEPQHADALAPLLQAAMELRGWEPPRLSDAAHRAARAGAHATLARRSNARRPAVRPFSLCRFAIAVAVVVAMLGATAVDTTAAQSLPGGTLYTWMRTKEQVTLALATDSGQRAQLHTVIAQRRLEELKILIDTGYAIDSTVAVEIVSSLLENAEEAIVEDERAPEVSVAPIVQEIMAETRNTVAQIAAIDQAAALDQALAARQVEQHTSAGD